jgi:tripartite-type tricarboxylate transporter receptor subunit TctC
MFKYGKALFALIAAIGPLAGLAAGLTAGPAAAQDFYKGKTITFVIGTAPGGGYDTYSRLIANFIGRHLPGQPPVVAQNMPGAAMIRATNYLYNEAPRDGTIIGMIDQAMYLNQIMGLPQLRADVTKFSWIGRVLSNSAVLYDWYKSPVKKIEDAYTHELIVSTTGAASRMNWLVLDNLLGMKLKLINGYQGSSDSRLALERGEVDALSQPWSVLKNENATWLKEGKINLLLQTGADAHPDLPQVPRMVDLARNDDERALLQLFSSPSTVGRSVMAPPGLPEARVKELRTAFDETLRDPALLEVVKQANLELDPLPGAELQAAIAGKGTLPAALIERARAIAEFDQSGAQ